MGCTARRPYITCGTEAIGQLWSLLTSMYPSRYVALFPFFCVFMRSGENLFELLRPQREDRGKYQLSMRWNVYCMPLRKFIGLVHCKAVRNLHRPRIA